MHRSSALMDELRDAKVAMEKNLAVLHTLKENIESIESELEQYPSLSNRLAVEVTDNEVIFLTAGTEFTITRDELQILVELLSPKTELPAVGEDLAPTEVPADTALDYPDFYDSKEAADLLESEFTELALKHSPRGDWYYRIRSGNPLRTTTSTDKTWKFRQVLRRKAHNKIPQKLVIELVTRFRAGNPCKILLTRTLWFGDGIQINPPTTR